MKSFVEESPSSVSISHGRLASETIAEQNLLRMK